MEELMLKIEHVSKQYKLGQIGGTTLYHELKRRRARRRGMADPTKKIGAREYAKGELFMALDDVSFAVRRGERVGIIGHNGAGKSTLLKLVSRITAPTGGTIGLNGRVASMLEVGTGFHPELTGRENIYMNGAILGMTRREIDSKMEDIIDFSECREFIDTPVRRYSSGMYVKLAFSVAAHLDSEILIMDEVLAVGDMAFQKKCLDKMNDVSRTEGRTILYVSHNMNTIRQLCDRVIVLAHGKVVFDGGVEDGINVYMNNTAADSAADMDLTQKPHFNNESTFDVTMKRLQLVDLAGPAVFNDEHLKMLFTVAVRKPLTDVRFRFTLHDDRDAVIATVWSDPMAFDTPGDKRVLLDFAMESIERGALYASIGFYRIDGCGSFTMLDHIVGAFRLEVKERTVPDNIRWNPRYWGLIRLQNIGVERIEDC